MAKRVFLEECWVIMKCERHANGRKVQEFGECNASTEGMGHSCWALDGTLCDVKFKAPAVEKLQYCVMCEVYKRYNRATGTVADLVRNYYPNEEVKYQQLLKRRIDNYFQER